MFGLKKSVTGMALDPGAIVVVRARKTGSGWVLTRSGGADVRREPAGDKPKFTLDATGFKGSANDALEASGIKGGSVALSIPDIYAKTAILEFEELPARAREADEVVKWKVSRQWYMAPEAISVDYQVLSKGAPTKVLAVALQKDVVSGYEDALFEMGLSTTNVNIHSLNLLRLIAGREGEGGVADNFSLIMRMGGYFSVSIFRDGVMDFYRCKSLHGGVKQFVAEVGSSFAFYGGKHPEVGLERAYVVNGDEGFLEDLRAVSRSEVIGIGPEDLIRTDGGPGPDLNPKALLAALGAAAAQ